jgi:hypothetical protein
MNLQQEEELFTFWKCVSRRCICEETAKQAEEKEAEAAGAKSSWLGLIQVWYQR